MCYFGYVARQDDHSFKYWILTIFKSTLAPKYCTIKSILCYYINIEIAKQFLRIRFSEVGFKQIIGKCCIIFVAQSALLGIKDQQNAILLIYKCNTLLFTDQKLTLPNLNPNILHKKI